MTALATLSRRARRTWASGSAAPPTPDRRRVPEVTVWQVSGRAMVWGLEAVRLLWVLARDRRRGSLGPRQVGRRAREAFERLGGTAVKLGQQMSIRLDMLPREVCEELGQLIDRGDPFDVAVARAELEASSGRPVEEVFRELDPEPVGAASIACVWWGRLHSGEEVAIKVQRPHVERQFAADLGAFALVTRGMELLSLVRPGFFAHLRSELRTMLLAELDFVAEARFQRLFRRYTREWDLDWVDAPRVHHELSGPRVLVSEFVRGMACHELIDLAESSEPAARDRLRELDIDPELVGRRILELAYWGNEDAPFFHADPHPGNILVLSGSRIAMLDFGAVGSMDGRSKRTLAGVLGSLATGRPGQATDYALVRMVPYPRLEVEDFRVEARETFERFFLAVEDPKSAWTERTTAALWLEFLESVQRYQIPVNLNTVHSIRSSLLYDSLAARLCPSLGFGVFRKYQRWAAPRRFRELAEHERRRRAPDLGSRLVSALARLRRELRAVERLVAVVWSSPAVRFLEHRERGLRAMFVAGWALVVVAVLLAVASLVVGLAPPAEPDAILAWLGVVTEPWPVRLSILVILALALRHASLRLQRADG